MRLHSNNFATKKYYEDIFERFIPPWKRGSHTMEKHMSKQKCEEKGLYLYGGLGDPSMIGHLDGRFGGGFSGKGEYGQLRIKKGFVNLTPNITIPGYNGWRKLEKVNEGCIVCERP